MKSRSRNAFRRAAIGLIAAYAIALQAVFTSLAPMPAFAAGSADPFAAHCFGNGGSTQDGAPGQPSPASGKMHCVFCGACAGGFVVLPLAALEVVTLTTVPADFVRPDSRCLSFANNARDGPARAPPPAV